MRTLCAVGGQYSRGGVVSVSAALMTLLAWVVATVAVQAATTRPSSLVPRPASFDRAAIIPIKDEITDVTRDSVRRRLKTAREQDTKLVVFELNTPGGMVSSTLEICDEIKKLRDEGVSVWAWVNNKAYSGGTVIALAADGIIMAPNATIGDSQMILMTPTGAGAVPEDLEAKMKSPLLAELRDSARRNGYDMTMVMAFVDPEIEIFWVENAETGERRFVGPRERDQLFGLVDTTRPAESGSEKSEKKDRSAGGTGFVSDTLSKTAWRYVKSAPGIGIPPQPIDGPRELLTLRTVEAEAYGFAQATVGNDGELSRYFNVTGPLERLESNWFESIMEWLASPMVRGVLFLLMLLGAYIEFQTPGFGLAGGVALVALVLFLGAPYAAGFTVTWEIVVILLGFALLAVELLVIPGFGVAGFLGLALLVLGLVASFVPKELPIPDSGDPSWWPTLPLTMHYLKRGLWALAGGMAGAIVCGVILARFLPRVPVAGRLVLPNPTRDMIEVDDPYEGLAQVGHIGKVEGTLRPAGKARFGAVLVDVVSDGEFIPSGTRVEVIERAGARVVVRRID